MDKILYLGSLEVRVSCQGYGVYFLSLKEKRLNQLNNPEWLKQINRKKILDLHKLLF